MSTSDKQKEVRKLIKEETLQLCGIIETRVKYQNILKIGEKSRGSPNCKTLKKLDRIMISEAFMDKYSESHGIFLPYLISDPSSALLKLPNECLNDSQAEVDKNPHNDNVKAKSYQDFKEYYDAMRDEHNLLMQKAKIEWLKDGDRNTEFFHKIVKGRMHKGRIMAICNEKGERFKNEKVAEHDDVERMCKGISDVDVKMQWEVNATLISLVKIQSTDKAFDFRPIACCNVICKCISKIIKNRLKGVLGYNRKQKIRKVAFKIDLQKAYDTIDWRFLKDISKQFGFPTKMIEWIMSTLWVKWVNYENLKGRSIWEVNAPANSSAGWKEMLRLRDKIRKHVLWKIGDGNSINAWYDNWDVRGPLCGIVTTREIYEAGMNVDTTVAELIAKNRNWPDGWVNEYPVLNQYKLPRLYDNINDNIVWVDNGGKERKFSVKYVWKDLCTEALKTMLSVNMAFSWGHIVEEMCNLLNNNNIWSIVRRIVLGAMVYFIWQERNNKIFKEEKRDVKTMV
nr:hypothetical protein [Tanacetum cinerariifolium]